MKIARISVLCLALGLGAGVAGVGAGCESSGVSDTSESKVDLDLITSHTTLVVGETATITARAYDTYGRNADVDWSTTAGDLDTEQNGRVARVKFNQPGTYTVNATLKVDGQAVKSDSVEIRVKPLP